MTIVQAELAEQRETPPSIMAIRGIPFKSLLLNLSERFFRVVLRSPSLTRQPFVIPTNNQRTVYAQDYSELDGSTGYWATKKGTWQEGFFQELDDAFWPHDEVSDAWISRYFPGRKLVKGSRKGKHKGIKGSKGLRCRSSVESMGDAKGKSRSKS